MSGNGGFFASRKYRLITKYVTGYGASLVILGALFKIMHWPGADQMLIVGLITESLIFAFIAMEPLHEEVDWTRVFPELGVEENNDENRLLPLLKKGGMGGGGAADHLAKELDKAGIDQALLSKLKDGMSNLADNAKSLGAISTAAGATDSYVKSLETASEGLSKLTEQYAASASAIAGIAGEVQGNNFGTEMQKLGQNLGALNNVYELQLKSSQDYLESMNQMTSLQDNIKGIMADLAASAQDTASYRENMAMLSQNLTDLNNVYGNMLRAMRG